MDHLRLVSLRHRKPFTANNKMRVIARLLCTGFPDECCQLRVPILKTKLARFTHYFAAGQEAPIGKSGANPLIRFRFFMAPETR